MESIREPRALSFEALGDRLLQFVEAKIHNGEFTERSLGKLLGVSQPQLHHVLKKKRKLQASLADTVLARFNISVLDLLTPAEIAIRGETAIRQWLSLRELPSDEAMRETSLFLLKKRPGLERSGPLNSHSEAV